MNVCMFVRMVTVVAVVVCIYTVCIESAHMDITLPF